VFLVGKNGSSGRVVCRLVNSLGSTFLDPVARGFFRRNSRRLTRGQRSRGLTGIGSGFGWVSGIDGRRRGVLRSARSIEEVDLLQT
jgi:hypothetical protein